MSQKMTREQLEKMLSDTRWETEWRAESDRAAAYYDGKQLTARLIETYKERGLAPLTRNLVGPTVDLVLGVEAKSRRDFKVVADLDTEVELADAMSFKLKQAERVAQADRACSDAFASMVKTGVGWVEVARESDPFRPPYRTVAVHRNEIFWDFRSTENDLSDARYLIRRRWVDQDIAMLRFPKKRALLERAIAGWADWDESLYRESASELLVGRETGPVSSLATIASRSGQVSPVTSRVAGPSLGLATKPRKLPAPASAGSVPSSSRSSLPVPSRTVSTPGRIRSGKRSETRTAAWL